MLWRPSKATPTNGPLRGRDVSLTVDLTGKIVSVTATGDFSVSDIRGAFTEIRSARMDLNPVLILVDDQGSRFLPDIRGVEEFVAVWSTIFKGRPVRIALLVLCCQSL